MSSGLSAPIDHNETDASSALLINILSAISSPAVRPVPGSAAVSAIVDALHDQPLFGPEPLPPNTCMMCVCKSPPFPLVIAPSLEGILRVLHFELARGVHTTPVSTRTLDAINDLYTTYAAASSPTFHPSAANTSCTLLVTGIALNSPTLIRHIVQPTTLDFFDVHAIPHASKIRMLATALHKLPSVDGLGAVECITWLLGATENDSFSSNDAVVACIAKSSAAAISLAFRCMQWASQRMRLAVELIATNGFIPRSVAVHDGADVVEETSPSAVRHMLGMDDGSNTFMFREFFENVNVRNAGALAPLWCAIGSPSGVLGALEDGPLTLHRKTSSAREWAHVMVTTAHDASAPGGATVQLAAAVLAGHLRFSTPLGGARYARDIVRIVTCRCCLSRILHTDATLLLRKVPTVDADWVTLASMIMNHAWTWFSMAAVHSFVYDKSKSTAAAGVLDYLFGQLKTLVRTRTAVDKRSIRRLLSELHVFLDDLKGDARVPAVTMRRYILEVLDLVGHSSVKKRTRFVTLDEICM
jgi:hypothetical protein